MIIIAVMSSIIFNWIVLFIIFVMYLINRWRARLISKINLEIAELKKEKETLIETRNKQKDFYQAIVKNYSAIIEQMN
jgi:uncharacterized membrane protein